MGVAQAVVGIVRLIIEGEFRVLPVKIGRVDNNSADGGAMAADPFGQ